MMGLKFRRQHPIGPCIVDFACIERGLIIELDGSQHMQALDRDAARDAFLRKTPRNNAGVTAVNRAKAVGERWCQLACGRSRPSAMA
jgi:very-short-patch-repair endonuclease